MLRRLLLVALVLLGAGPAFASMDFDGTGDVLTVTAPITVDPMTMCTWVNKDTISVLQAVMQVDDGTANNRNTIDVDGTGHPRAATNGAAAGVQAATATATISGATWTHICATFTSATARAIFVSGANKVTNATSRSIASISTLSIGTNNSGGLWTGLLQEVAIWNITLADSDVADLATGLSPMMVHPESLVFYLPGFDVTNVTDRIFGTAMTVAGNPTANDNYGLIYYPSAPTLEANFATIRHRRSLLGVGN